MKKPTRYELERCSLKNRPRKVLNLEERVLAIRLYRRNPIYQRVATVFKCSWEQIRNIVTNRDDIINYYGRSRVINTNDPPHYVRNKKINFLGQATYEFVRRAYYHRSAPLNDEMLRKRAFEFRDILEIEQFFPNKTWINDFKKVYNIDLAHMESLVIGEKPPQTLNSKEIVNYCHRLVDRMMAMRGETLERSGKRAERKTNDNSMREYEAEYEETEEAELELEADAEVEAVELAELQYDNSASSTMDFSMADHLLDSDVRVVHESLDFAGMYTEEFHSELATEQEETTTKYDNNGNAMPTPTQILNELQIKQERCSLTPSPVRNSTPSLSSPQPLLTIANVTSTNEAMTTLFKTTPTPTPKPTPTPLPLPTINNYAEALQALQPLEDFATNAEDFRALHLLRQLVEVCEKSMLHEEQPQQQRRRQTRHSSYASHI